MASKGAIWPMLIWMAVVGAMLGWVLGDFEEVSFFAGGLFGLLIGWGLRRAIRGEVAAATAVLHDELAALRVAVTAPRPGPVEIDPPVTLPTPDVAPVATAVPDQIDPVYQAMSVEQTQSFTAHVLPEEPGWLTKQLGQAFAAARGWLFGGNTVVRLGLVILLVGLSFLASYAASAGLFPIELRLALVGVVGIGLLATGFRTRHSRPDFALALQGGGVAVVYLALFGATRFYDLVPLGAAFALMLAVCALGCALALLQQSQALAVTAFAGGFAVPLLLGGEGGNPLGLFGYGTILNLAILFIARARAWRMLNLVGFAATFGIAGLWGAGAYRPEYFILVQAFLIVSVLIYVAIAISYTRAAPGRFGNAVDTTLLFGPALAGFGLEVALVGDRPFGSAVAALGFGALYLGVTAYSMRTRREGMRVMNDATLAIAIGFVTMAVPLALGVRWTSAAWALEGAGAFWVGVRQARWLPRLFGILLQGVASLLYLGGLHGNVAALPFANAAFVGAVLVALGWLATAWLARRPIAPGETPLAHVYGRVEANIATPAFLAGFVLWWLGWTLEATRLTPPVERSLSPVPVFSAGTSVLLSMLAFLASAAAFQLLERRRDWAVAGWPARVGVAALWLGILGVTGRGDYVLYSPCWLLWLAASALHVWMLRRADETAGAPGARAAAAASHVGGVWLAVALIANMLWLGIARAALWSTAWSEVTLLAGTVAVLAALASWTGPALRDGGEGRRWPLDRYAALYGWTAAAPIAVTIFAGALLTSLFSSGDADPLPFVPLLNPVDLMVALAAGVLLLWRRTVLRARPLPSGAALIEGRGAWLPLAVLGFVAANGAWLRTAHHLAGIPWNADMLLASPLVETGIAILWTLIALTLMVVAHRRAVRGIWLAGAVLLGATVVKLLIVDLNATGGGARIIAFIAVGLLMLLVGYLAPLPPKRGDMPEADDPIREGAVA